MNEAESPPAGEVAIRIIAMPSDANPSGDIFGGWIMSMMDMAGGTTAYHRAKGRVATVAVDKIEFHRPVAVGDEVSCYTEVVRVGRTSIAVRVDVWARSDRGGTPTRVTEGVFTFVAVDPEGRPRPVDRQQGDKGA